MDPISHALLGRALNCLDVHKRLGRGAGAAFVLGSLAPDIDGGLVTRGWDVYLHYHPTGTHTLVAAPLLAAATAGLVRVLLRRSDYRRLALSALVGVVVGHLAFDLVSGSDMRLLAPISWRVFGPHLLTMADLTAIVVLLAGTAVSWWRRKAGGIAIVAGLAVLLATKAVSLNMAWNVYRGHVTSDEVSRPEAFNGSLTRWRFFDRLGETGRVWTVDVRSARATLNFTRAIRIGGDTAIEQSRHAPAVRRFFGFAELPIVRVENADRERRVLWSDLKYCEPTGCVMWFGAVLDERGDTVAELVQIGGFVTRRALR